MVNLSTRAGTAGEVNFAYDENGRMLTQEYAPARLEKCNLNGGRGIRTMGDIARVSVKNPDALYKMKETLEGGTPNQEAFRQERHREGHGLAGRRYHRRTQRPDWRSQGLGVMEYFSAK